MDEETAKLKQEREGMLELIDYMIPYDTEEVLGPIDWANLNLDAVVEYAST